MEFSIVNSRDETGTRSRNRIPNPGLLIPEKSPEILVSPKTRLH